MRAPFRAVTTPGGPTSFRGAPIPEGADGSTRAPWARIGQERRRGRPADITERQEIITFTSAAGPFAPAS